MDKELGRLQRGCTAVKNRIEHGRHPTRPRWRLWNAVTLWMLHVRALRRLADRQVCELRFIGAHSGQVIALPVMYAQRDDTLVILVGGPEQKRWWRSFRRLHPVRVWLRGADRFGTGRLVESGSPERFDAARIYENRFPDLPVEDDPFVVVTLDPPL